MEEVIQQQRSLPETPTYLVASVVTVLVFFCFLVERSIHRFGKWLKKTKRKALFASLEKIKEELMLLGLISLFLAQCARWISEICVDSSLFNSRFYICSEKDYDNGIHVNRNSETHFSFLNKTHIPPSGIYDTHSSHSHQCGKGREPFVSYEGLEQLHRFLFVLGITHVLYGCVAVGLAMSKIYSWRKWENQATLQAKIDKVLRRQSTFVFHHTSHPWSRNPILIWMLCFLRQFRNSIRKSDYLALRLGFITVFYFLLLVFWCPIFKIFAFKLAVDWWYLKPHSSFREYVAYALAQKHKLPQIYDFHKYMVRSMEEEFNGILGISWPLWGYAIVCIFVNIHGLNIYFWLSFIPAILVMLVGTKLQHVVSSLALEIVEQSGPSVGTQLKPRDDLFWFGKPEILLRLIQFIIFQNAFEMATFIWSLWGLKQRSCFMDNNILIIVRLASGLIVQFWCSYSTVPLNIIVTQMGSRFKKTLVTGSVRDSLHSWCKRVKARSKRDSLHPNTTRSACSLESTTDERDEITTASGTLSRSSSLESENQLTVTSSIPPEEAAHGSSGIPHAFRMEEYLSESVNISTQPPTTYGEEGSLSNREEAKTLFELFQNT